MGRVLIVDDNDDNRYLLQVLLEGIGHQVLAAANGAEALALARLKSLDAVVSDILMPVMDGFALCREWKADPALKSIPFMFYTATYTEPKDEAFALSLGADRFVVKPQTPEVLAQALQELLASGARAPGRAAPLAGTASQKESELEFVKHHRDAVIRKLEDKMREVEAANAALRQDVVERQRAEEAAREAERKFHGIFANAIEGIFQATLDGRFLTVNPALARMLGYESPEELLAGASTPTYRWDAAVWELLLRQVRTGVEVRGLECGLVRGDGSRACVSISARRVEDSDPSGALLEGMVEDVTERRRLEQELQQSQKMEAVGRLAGGIAHDFNNVLQAMLSHVEMLPRGRSAPDVADARLDEVTALIRRGATLTRQLLLFSRRETSKPERLDLNRIVGEVASMLQRLLRSDIAFTLDLCPDALPILADRGQIEQVLMNLAVNAGDAMPDGGRLVVRTGLDPSGSVVVSVEDTGSGIAEDIRSRVFEPFFTTKPAGEGTGLGLSVVHGIVTRHGGKVELESQPGRGSCFTVTLPLAAGTTPPETVKPECRQTPSAPRSGRRILVVEDESGARAVLGEILTTFGYEVLAVSTGAEARSLLAGPAFDLLLTDLTLPDESGVGLARDLSARWQGMKVVLMSGFTEDETVRGMVAGGAARFLQKPFNLGALEREVRAALGAP